MIADIRILTVDKIMKEYYIGKYEGIIKKITLENSETVSLYNDYALVDNEQFQLVTQNKYYSQKRKIYLEILYDAIVFSKPSYESKQEKEYFKIIHTKDLLQSEMKHNPKRLVEILNLFTKDNPIKYTTHSFEWSIYKSYDNFMNAVKQSFDVIDEELKRLSPNLHTKITKFLFDSQLSEDNTWGVYNIAFGWSSPELNQWSQLEESKDNGKKAISYKLPKKYQRNIDGKTSSTFNDICDLFKNEIEIKDNDILILLFQSIEEEVLGFDFDVSYENLDGMSFYTDVENFSKGLKLIFEQFKDSGREQHDTINIEAMLYNDAKYIDIRITQVGSTVSKTSTEMKSEIEDGGFQDIKNYFTSLCDWSIEAKFKDGDFKIDYLSIDSEDSIAKNLNYTPIGFTYILRFYK